MKLVIRSEADVDLFINTVMGSYSEGKKVKYNLTLPNGWWMYFLATEMEKKRRKLEKVYGHFDADGSDVEINFTLANYSVESKTERALIDELKGLAEKMYGEVDEDFETQYLEGLEELINNMFDDDTLDDDYPEGAD